MHKLITAIFILLFATIASASTTTISASNITDLSGAKVTMAKLCFVSTDGNGTAIGYRDSTAQIIPVKKCGLVSHGALQSGFTVFDSSTTVPTNVRYHITLQSANGTVLRDFGTTTIIGTTWTLDTYDASATALAALYTASSTSGDLTVNGSLTVADTINATVENAVNASNFTGTTISMTGGITASAAQLGETLSGNSHIEIGNISGTASTPYMDWHSTGGTEDYDARIIASAGTSGTTGLGNLEVYASSLILHATSAWSFTDTGLTSASVVGTSSTGLLQATSTIGSGNVVLATSPTITTPTITSPTISGAIYQSGGENHFGYGTYTDPSSNYSYDAKFGGTSRGIAVNGFSIFNGDVNIGGTTDVGRFAAAGEIISTTIGSVANFRMIEGSYGSFFRNDGTDTYLMVTASGDQYGGYSALRPFWMNNSTGNISMGENLSVGGSVTGASWTATSDRREKHNIQTVEGKSALDKVMALRAVTYNWNDPKQDTQKQTGWIAQEVEKAGLNSSVVTKPGELHHADGTTTKVDDFKTLKQNEMTAILWSAVQELNHKVDAQQKEINQLKQQLKHRGKK